MEHKNNLMTDILIENICVNREAGILSIKSAINYLEQTRNQLKFLNKYLCKGKKIMLNKITPALASDVLRDSGIKELKCCLEAMENYVCAAEIVGHKTLASSSLKDVKNKHKNTIFPLTNGVHLIEEPAHYDIECQNFVLKPVYVGLKDLGLFDLYLQLLRYCLTCKALNCCETMKEEHKLNSESKVIFCDDEDDEDDDNWDMDNDCEDCEHNNDKCHDFEHE